ncbi:glutamate-1-semialdehyde-2,1-aminomutase [bacterium]|nr:MAG: glutamate-1-semialdehyde-2,1-aminomutase [bacterium]
MIPYTVKLLNRAKDLIPGGVNSPVRAFKGVGGNPPFIKKAKGSKLFDEDGNRYIDYIGSWGPMILGHGHPDVLKAIHTQLDIGTSYGAPTKLEVEMAEIITSAMPSIEMVRMVNSGTEATMSAIRVARGFTGKNKIIKFSGCYHGHGDMLLSHAGSGVATLGLPDSPGVPKSVAQDTLTVPFNDITALEQVFEAYPYDIACLIIEPVTGNMGVVMPLDGYLQKVRELCTQYDTLLIFDEVMTGFRVAFGGAQSVYNIKPDLTCLGKIIGGGLPVGAYGGRRDIMEKVAPSGPIYQAGTLSGNPLAMAAGITTLKLLQDKTVYTRLDEKAKILAKGFEAASDKYNIPICLTGLGSMMCIFFTNQPVLNYDIAKQSDLKLFNEYFWSMHRNGIYLAPSQFEAIFISLAHTKEDLDKTIYAVDQSFKHLSELKN